jgi:RHS repeat-associated protein
MVNLDGLLQELGLVPGTNYDLTTLSEKQEIESSSSYTGVDDFRNSNSDCQGDTTCLCEADPYWAQLAGYECAQEQIMYWYHPDYLGNTELITDAAGRPYQYFLYTPWGEVLETQRQWGDFYDTRYQFNGKEHDPETGNYYYGARYYDPETGIWLSVDPMSHYRPSLTPYNFVSNNPIMRVDPKGMLDICKSCPDQAEFDKYRNSKENYTYNAEDGLVYTDQKQEITLNEVEVVFGNNGNKGGSIDYDDGIAIYGFGSNGVHNWNTGLAPKAQIDMADPAWSAIFGVGQKGKYNEVITGSFWSDKLVNLIKAISDAVQVADDIGGGSEGDEPVAPVPQFPKPTLSSTGRKVIHEDYYFGDKDDSLMNRYYYSRDQDGKSTYDSVKYNFYNKDDYGK